LNHRRVVRGGGLESNLPREGPPDAAFVVGLPQHPDEHGPECSILLAVDQELGEGVLAHLAQGIPRAAMSPAASGGRTVEPVTEEDF
jgi:hypothetical protein